MKKLINAVHHFNKLEKQLVTILIEAEIIFGRIQHLFMILKNSQCVKNRRNFFNLCLIRDIYENMQLSDT
jgi:hypothetical protein